MPVAPGAATKPTTSHVRRIVLDCRPTAANTIVDGPGPPIEPHARNTFMNRFIQRRKWLLQASLSICVLGAMPWGCGVVSPSLDQLLALSRLDQSNTTLDLAVAIAQPAATVTAAVGAPTIIQWADIAKVPGTVVRVAAQRQDALQADTGDPIQLIGDGTPGSGRDAVSDGQSDQFDWDITGVRIGDYVIVVTIEAPDGRSITVRSRDADRATTGIIQVTTALPAPTLTFTNPGATDVTATAPTTVNLTWTDNGVANADAQFVLGLDLDAAHDNGNEIILLRDALSTDGNTGQFVFSFVDENGNGVPAGTYTVFAQLDDNANAAVTREATGKLIVVP